MRYGRMAWFVLALALGTAPAAAAAEVVAHSNLPENNIPRALLRGVFGMRVRAWPDGTAVRVFVLDDNDPLHQEFCRSVLRMYPYQLRQNWDRLLYSGTGQPPVVVSTQEELLRQVAATPGAIGYIANRPPAPRKGPALPANVKVIDVQ